jgi:hypothetical protein
LGAFGAPANIPKISGLNRFELVKKPAFFYYYFRGKPGRFLQELNLPKTAS